MRVLLVDDDADQLALRAMLLERNGFQPLTASGHEAALELARADHPECAVVDLRLPTTEIGLETLRSIRVLCPQSRILVLTGSAQQSPAVQQALQYADGAITKGSGMTALLETLHELRAADKGRSRK